MHLPRRLMAVAPVLVAPATAAAAQPYSDTISGYEYNATSTDGGSAGTAAGALPGYWNADVQHTASATPAARPAQSAAAASPSQPPSTAATRPSPATSRAATSS